MPKNSASKCPTPNANCGTTCATVAWAGANFAVKNRLVRMWAISSVTSQHLEQAAYDAERSRYLESRG